jgi:branched-chain amino acid transport system permease protein
MDDRVPLPSTSPRRRWLCIVAQVALVLLLLAVPALFQAIGQPYYLRVATRVLIFAIAASSLNLVLGYGGMISLGHAAFVGLGSYLVAILAWHSSNDVTLTLGPFSIQGTFSAAVAWPAAVIAAALSALVIGAVSLRTSGLYFIMITLAFAQMIYYYGASLEQYGGDDGMRMRGQSTLPGLDLSDRTTFYYLVLVAFLACLVLIYFLTRSRFGLVIQGIRQNQIRMRAIGIEPYGYQLTCFVISGAIAGLAGVLLANLDSFVSPADLSLARSSELVAMILIGGVGSLWGPPLGAAFYIVLQLVLGTLTTHWPLYFGPALIFIVMFARTGLVGLMGGRVSQ